MSQHYNLLEKLKGVRAEANLMVGANGESARTALDHMIEAAKKDPNDEKIIERSKMHDGLRRAAAQGQTFTYPANCELMDGSVRNAGDVVDARAEVSRIQVISINNFIAPKSAWLGFFQIENFADNVVPYWNNTTQYEMNFALVGQDGGVLSRAGQIVKSQSQIQLPGPWELASPVVKYKLRDLQRGSVADEMLGLIDLARDQALNLDQRLATIAKSTSTTLKAFNWTTGAPEKRTAMLHSSIDSANLPSTNIIANATWGGRAAYVDKIDKDLLDQAIIHGAKLSEVYDMDIRPVEFLYPSSSVFSLITAITQTTQDQHSTFAGQIAAKGFISEAYGYKMAYRPLSTLGATTKYAYVRYNRPIGIVGFKPGMDQTFSKRDEQKNVGEISTMKVWTAAVAEQWRTGIARIQFKA